MGLCQAYNQGAEQANYEVICFVHEDVEFLQSGWGAKILKHFSEDQGLGLIGLAGSRYKSPRPSGWSNGYKQDICINIWHGRRDNMSRELVKPDVYKESSIVPVVALDGVFLCATKAAWEISRFDERLTGFHFYDVDFSLRVSRKYKVAVVYDVELVHYSLGNFNEAWAREAICYAKAPPMQLPIYTGLSLSPAEIEIRERSVGRYWMKILRKKDLSLQQRLAWLWVSRIWCLPSLITLSMKFLFLPKTKRLK